MSYKKSRIIIGTFFDSSRFWHSRDISKVRNLISAKSIYKKGCPTGRFFFFVQKFIRHSAISFFTGIDQFVQFCVEIKELCLKGFIKDKRTQVFVKFMWIGRDQFCHVGEMLKRSLFVTKF